MPSILVYHEGNALAFVCLAADEFRFAAYRRIDRVNNLIDVMSVYFETFKTKCFVFSHYIAKSHNIIIGTIDLESVVVQDHNEVIQFVVSSRHSSFPHDTFLDLSVADDRVNFLILILVFCSHCKSACDGYALSQRTCVYVHTRCFLHIRMSLQMAVDLTK